TSTMNGYLYRCVAVNGTPTCFANSNAAMLSISNISLASYTKSDVSCHGGSNGVASVSPTGGIGSYTYLWSPSGGAGSVATGLAAGTYTVTVKDDIGCEATHTFTINAPAEALLATATKTDVSCFGGSNGTATVT